MHSQTDVSTTLAGREPWHLDLIAFLAETQNPDGGWGYLRGRQSATEASALAALALQSTRSEQARLERVLGYLRGQQRDSGGWPVNASDPSAAAWVSAWAGFALFRLEGWDRGCQKAAGFILENFGPVRLPWTARLGRWLRGEKPPEGESLGGWMWNPGTATWVEPTACALLFLKAVEKSLGADSLSPVIDEAERMLYNRMCPSGGWNYGNARVLGEALRPFPLTTAIALLALQDRDQRSENQQSVEYLNQATRQDRSATSLSLAGLCLEVYGRPWRFLIPTLSAMYAETRYFENTKATALALLASRPEGESNPFRLG
ncbi:MAG: hypothetical protein AB1898_24020 [Acidobacteriota bacterium]